MLRVFGFLWLVITVLGMLNWVLIGSIQFDLVQFLFGGMSVASRVVYSLIGFLSIGYLFFLRCRKN